MGYPLRGAAAAHFSLMFQVFGFAFRFASALRRGCERDFGASEGQIAYDAMIASARFSMSLAIGTAPGRIYSQRLRLKT